MSHEFQCGDNTALVAFVYDECEPEERTAIDAHVRVCGVCAAELATLGSTRRHLAAWTPPEVELGFRVVAAASGATPEASGARPERGPGLLVGGDAWWRRPLPAWAQAAAALLIFAAGLSLGIARGTALPPAPALAPVLASDASLGTVAAPVAAVPAPSVDDLAALEQSLREEVAALRVAAAAPRTEPDAQWLARVRTLILESEQRQQRELALRTTQIVRDFDLQRRTDLAQIQRTVGQIEGLAGAEVREQRQMLNYLIRTSQSR